MIITAIILLLFIIGIVLFVTFFKSRKLSDYTSKLEYEHEKQSRSFAKYTGLTFIVVSLVLLFLSTFTIVNAAQVGVPVSFGKVGNPLSSGVHFVAPWTKVESFPIRPFAVPDVTIAARTSQAGSVRVTAGARWQVVASEAKETYLQVRTGDEQKISETVVDKALGTAIGNVYVTLDNATATTDRVNAESLILNETNRLVNQYGIKINNVFLRSVEPDSTTSDALARVAAQQRATQIAILAVQTAEKQAEANRQQALGIQQAAKAVAGLMPVEVQALCINAWEREVAKGIEAGVPVYTNPCSAQQTSLAVPAK